MWHCPCCGSREEVHLSPPNGREVVLLPYGPRPEGREGWAPLPPGALPRPRVSWPAEARESPGQPGPAGQLRAGPGPASPGQGGALPGPPPGPAWPTGPARSRPPPHPTMKGFGVEGASPAAHCRGRTVSCGEAPVSLPFQKITPLYIDVQFT
jgi:hypothetical protein